MATAAPSATLPDYSVNYYCLWRLVIDKGGHVLRTLLEQELLTKFPHCDTHNPQDRVDLHVVLGDVRVKHTLMKQKQGFTHHFQKLLYPGNQPSTTVKIADLDFTLVVFLLRNICSFNKHCQAWNNPQPGDTSIVAEIGRLKQARNELANGSTTQFRDNEFKVTFQKVSATLMKLSPMLTQTELDVIRDSGMSDAELKNKQKFAEGLVRNVIYQRALKRGKCKMYKTRVVLVGQSGAGKTRLLKRLLHEPYKEESTNGVEISLSECKVERSCVVNWKKQEDNFSIEGEVYLRGIRNYVNKPNEEGTVNYMNKLQEEETDAADMSEKDKKKTDTFLGEINKEIDLQAKRRVNENAHDEAPTYHQVSFWDFAGQHVFYTTHQTFLTKRAIYLAVHDMSVGMDEKIVTKRPGNQEPEEVESGPQTHVEYLLYWLKSVHVYACDEEECTDSTYSLPAILIVGTHKDKLAIHSRELDAASREKDIHAKCKQWEIDVGKKIKPYLVLGKTCPRIFTIDNTKQDDDDDGTKKLREEIDSILKEEIWCQEVPLTWVKLGYILKHAEGHESDNKMKVVDFDYVEKFAGSEVGMQRDEIESFLIFYHELGELLFFNEPNLHEVVVIDPQFLIDAFKVVLTAKCFQDINDQKHTKHWMKLNDEGKISKNFIFSVWQKQKDKELFEKYKNSLLGMMVKLDMLVENTSEHYHDDNVEYYVPSFMKRAKENNLDVVECGPGEPVPLKYQSAAKMIPEGLFHRLLSRCLKKWEPFEDRVFCNYTCFILNDEILLSVFSGWFWRLDMDIELRIHLRNEEHRETTWAETNQVDIANAQAFIHETLEDLAKLYHGSVPIKFYVNKNNKDFFFTKEDILAKPFIPRSKIHTEPYRLWFKTGGTSSTVQVPSSQILSQKVQHKHMSLVSKSGLAQEKWQQLTRAMGLKNKEHDLRRIVYQESYENAVYKALEYWVSANGRDATVGKLAEILEEEGLKDLAEALESLTSQE